MKIVITGALGHIGARLIRDLTTAFTNCDITLLDNFFTQRYCSLFNLPSNVKYHFVEGDILDYALEPLFDGAAVVIHLAAITDAASSHKHTDWVEKVNVSGTERVARACAEVGAPLVFLSTTSVYGSQAAFVDEDCPEADLKPQSPYALSKLKAEKLLNKISGEQSGLRYQICRFGTISGVSVGMRFHTAVNKFCWQAAMGVPITVWKTALHQKRPYLSLTDAVHALVFIINNQIYHNCVYNVLTANLTPDDIIEMIKKYLPQIVVEYTDAQIMNQLSYEVSWRRFKELGFELPGSVEGDIAQTITLLKNAGEKNGSKEDLHTL